MTERQAQPTHARDHARVQFVGNDAPARCQHAGRACLHEQGAIFFERSGAWRDAKPTKPVLSTHAGTHRRLHALMNRSWSLPAIARATALRALQLARVIENPATITPRLAVEVSAAYDQLWDAAPPLATQADRDLADAAGVRARECGWARPVAWDDELIDQPDARPANGWQRPLRSTLRSAELAEGVAFIRSDVGYQHASLRTVAMWLGVSEARLEKALSRHRYVETRDRHREAV
jgi:hypothetical protein